MGPIGETRPWRMSFAHSKNHICAAQVFEAQAAFKAIMQIVPQLLSCQTGESLRFLAHMSLLCR